MQAVAKAKFQRMSARKVRRVIELIKGKDVEDALDVLAYTPKYAASLIEDTLKSAAANALNIGGTSKLKAEDLRIKDIFVDGGPVMKRIRPTSMGRAYRIRKRTCHLTVVLEGKPKLEKPKLVKKPMPKRKAAKSKEV
ncbi:MAG: 50S ribosomal protein L22 [candidate division Zixibacteria bacterium]|nr:50S ribosomal protein L22 [candidate division Zixibacteria bacterium]